MLPLWRKWYRGEASWLGWPFTQWRLNFTRQTSWHLKLEKSLMKDQSLLNPENYLDLNDTCIDRVVQRWRILVGIGEFGSRKHLSCTGE
jgi:hypothetical protein